MLLSCSVFIAQNKINLNKYENKIQLYGGTNFAIFAPDRTIGGFEMSSKIHNIGFNRMTNIDYGFGLFGPSGRKSGYEKWLIYYGLRVSRKFISTSLNVGVGRTKFYHTTEKTIFVNTDPWSLIGYNKTIYTVHSEEVPCLEFMLKSNFTGRANGIGLILAANLNNKESFIDARVVVQLGYEWSWKKKKDKLASTNL